MLKKILYTLALLIIVGITAFLIADEPLPEGEQGARAEYLAEKMLKNLNYEAWQDLNAIAWSYPLGHHFIWDKKANLVEATWDDKRVIFSPETKEGKVYIEGEEQTEEIEEHISKAFEYFANDSFWLIAPYKVTDPGTKRSVVDYEGKEALLVQYTSGGVTPGDSYLWILDDKGRPTAWKFWVDILPIGGLKFSWENWVNVEGAQISTLHDGLIDIEIEDLEAASDVAQLNDGTDPFAPIR
ncbi:hypothetical protein E1176_19895 [Fulvivirga sp. RKSG066]|uniref:hypothetical protein n=1 Tax=Fulvivirga aurantia TaxID=2529383 RepID=UPI0016274224|nr:hypothetical protein [Fulvivirga aurantia]MTI23302.1 hypothetical protein [Fulvivirga aurantia]